jgi:UDPglucose 6-dehydrogenase
MHKPAFVFDGRNILPREEMQKLGFRVFAIGKPLT